MAEIGSEEWLNRLSRNQEALKHVDMLPIAAEGQFDPETMKRDVYILKARLKRMGRFLVNPRAKVMQYWDFVILFAMIFTCTVTPYEVCLLWEDQGFGGLFYANIFINVLFIADTVLQFFLPFNVSLKKGGGTVKSHRKIAKHYIESWFVIDFISIFPIDYILLGVDVDSENLGLLRATRMLRLLRLIKLVRILRASRIFSRWENSISMKFAYRDLLQFTIFVILTLHWLSCAFGMSAQLMQAVRTPELKTVVEAAIRASPSTCYGCIESDPVFDKYCSASCLTPCELQQQALLDLPNGFPQELVDQEQYLSFQESWVCRGTSYGTIRPMQQWGEGTPFELWIVGVYISLMSMGGGVGSIVPSNTAEYCLFLVSILIGSVLWATVVGTICGIAAAGNPFKMAYKHSMDQLNYFLEDMSMPIDVRHRSREYLRNARELGKKLTYNELVDRLSPEIRQDIVLRMSKTTLQCVWYFSEFSDGPLVELAMRLQREGYAPRERIKQDKLTILMRGVAAKAGIILTFQGGQAGSHPFWGEDIILSSKGLRDRKPAAALTYIEVTTLTKADINAITARFPEERQKIHEAAVLIGLRRAMVVVSEYIKTMQSRDMVGGTHIPKKMRKKGLGNKGAERKKVENADEANALDVIGKIRMGAEEYAEVKKGHRRSEDLDNLPTEMHTSSVAGAPADSRASARGLFGFANMKTSTPRSAAHAEGMQHLFNMLEKQDRTLHSLTTTVATLSKHVEKLTGLSA